MTYNLLKVQVALLLSLLATAACMETTTTMPVQAAAPPHTTTASPAMNTSTGSGVSALAGKTCVGYYDFGFPAQYDFSKGAIWLKLDETGKAILRNKEGRVAMENWNKVSSPDGYKEGSLIQLREDGDKIKFDTPMGGWHFTLTPTGPSTFGFDAVTESYAWHGKAECRR